MTTPLIRFDDGAAYERFMGVWSRLAGETFLDWLAPDPALRWLDVGCGNGAFTALLAERCAPASIDGIDPSEAQLAYARARPDSSGIARFERGDAMALPFADATFDAAVMPLVIFFVPEPAVGVAEMVRVVQPGGLVAAYAWDMHGGGLPYDPLQREMRALGLTVAGPPSPESSRREVMDALWRETGLEEVAMREITVRRTFASFDDYWTTVRGGPSVAAALDAMTADEHAQLVARMRERLAADAAGRITCEGRANAIRGRVPR